MFVYTCILGNSLYFFLLDYLGIMELSALALLANKGLRQYGAFFISLMYTGALINTDLEVWEAVLSGAIATLASVVFADSVLTERENEPRRRFGY